MDKKLAPILLVEDDEVDIMNVKRAFKKNDVQNALTVTKNGLEALEYLKKTLNDPAITTPRIILLDINMPKMNGIEFLTQLRKLEDLKNISVFVLTTSREDSDIIEAYNLNVAGYIIKPLSFERFLEAVSKLNDFWKLSVYP